MNVKKLMKILLITHLISVSALAQHETGNGGDVLVNEFTGTIDNIVKTITNLRSHRCAKPDLLSSLMKEVKVISVPNVFVDGVEQDARSITQNGKKVTELSRFRLIENVDSIRYANLVLHEYYVHQGIEKTNQTTHSKDCLDSLTEANIDISKLVYHENRIKTPAKLIDAGTIALSCTKADGGFYKIFIKENSYYKKRVLVIEEWTSLGAHSHAFESSAFVDFSFSQSLKRHYDILTGKTRYLLNESFETYSAPLTSRQMTLSIESADQVLWTATWSFTNGKTHHKPRATPFYNLSCHLVSL